MNEKLPFSEASGKKPLHGTYKISFVFDVNSGDDILASDIGLILTQGLGDSLIEKVSAVDVEKIYKTAAVPLKPGDLVYINKNIVVKATVVKDKKGFYCVGSAGDPISEEHSIRLERGLIAEVNKVAEGQADLIGFDNVIEASFIDPETNEPYNEWLRIDRVAVDVDAVEKINPACEEGK